MRDVLKTVVVTIVTMAVVCIISEEGVKKTLRNHFVPRSELRDYQQKCESATMSMVQFLIDQKEEKWEERFTNVLSRVAVLMNKQEEKIRQVEWNDQLDRCLRESLLFTVVSGRVTNVEFDGGRFAREYFESFPGCPSYSRLRISDMSPKTSFSVREEPSPSGK